MSGFDGDRIYSVSIHDPAPAQGLEKPAEIERLLIDFLMQYRLGGEFIYRSFFLIQILHGLFLIDVFVILRDKLRANLLLKLYYLEVDLQHLGLFHEELGYAIQQQPGEIMPLVSPPQNI